MGSKERQSDSPLAPYAVSAAELRQRLEVERRGVPFLFYLDEEGGQRLVELPDAVESLTLGRGKTNDIVLAWDPEVSRVHAQLERLGGLWTVADDQLSSSGTFVNGARVAGCRRLRDGDVLRLRGRRSPSTRRWESRAPPWRPMS